jgi:3-methyladenine DNA glycosylase AlkD
MPKPSKFYQQYLTEVERIVNTAPTTVDAQRKLARHKYSFSSLPFAKQILIWNCVWKNGDAKGWVKIQAFFYCEKFSHNKDILASGWNLLKTWQDYVSGWGECDALAKLYTKILEIIPDKVMPYLKQWNKSANPWKRRQSVVSLLYFQRTKKNFLPFAEIIKLVDSLLDDQEYYVQKGVGWSLKELYQVYPHSTFRYLKQNIKKIKPEAYPHTIEKLTIKEKQQLKRLRK